MRFQKKTTTTRSTSHQDSYQDIEHHANYPVKTDYHHYEELPLQRINNNTRRSRSVPRHTSDGRYFNQQFDNINIAENDNHHDTNNNFKPSKSTSIQISDGRSYHNKQLEDKISENPSQLNNNLSKERSILIYTSENNICKRKPLSENCRETGNCSGNSTRNKTNIKPRRSRSVPRYTSYRRQYNNQVENSKIPEDEEVDSTENNFERSLSYHKKFENNNLLENTNNNIRRSRSVPRYINNGRHYNQKQMIKSSTLLKENNEEKTSLNYTPVRHVLKHTNNNNFEIRVTPGEDCDQMNFTKQQNNYQQEDHFDSSLTQIQYKKIQNNCLLSNNNECCNRDDYMHFSSHHPRNFERMVTFKTDVGCVNREDDKDAELGRQTNKLGWHDNKRLVPPHYTSESESINSHSTEASSSAWYSPLSDGTSDNDSDVLVESCLRELEEKGFNTSNIISNNPATMNGMQVSSHSTSHSYRHETSSNATSNSYYANHNGSSSSRYHSNVTQQSSYQGNNDAIDRPHRPEPNEELYDFGSVKYTNGSVKYARDLEKGSVDGGSIKSSRSYRDNKLDQEYMDDFDDMMSQISSISHQSEPPPTHQYSSTGFSKKADISSITRASTLPRPNGHAAHRDIMETDETIRFNSATLPRMREEESERPTSSTPVQEPLSEAIVEEERHNPDGTTSLIRRIVTATTTRVFHENQVPKVEVHISPATETIISSPPSMSTDDIDDEDEDDEGPQLNSSTIHQQHDRRQQHITTTSSYQQEYRQRRENQQSMMMTRESDQSYDASGSHLDYSGHDENDSDVIIQHEQQQQKLLNNLNNTTTMTTVSSTLNTSYHNDGNDHRGRNRQRQSHHNNSRQTSTSSYNSRDRRIDEHEIDVLDIGHGVEAVDSSSLYNDSFYKSSIGGGAVSSAKSSSSNMDVASKTTSTMKQSAFSKSSASASASGHQEQRQQQNNHDFSTLDAKIKEKKSGHDLDISLLDILMYLKTSDIVLKANTAGYIMHLTYSDDEVKRKIREFDIIPLLVKLLDHEDEDCHRNAAGALRNLSYGKFVNDNKVAIHECGGIAACVRLLYRTTWIEVRQHLTGILCNLSSYESLKLEILYGCMEAIALLIIVPLSGWEKDVTMKGGRASIVSWSLLLRNATGILRNVSSAGVGARKTIRAIEGLVDACVWILKAAIASDENGHVDIKIVENVMCTLRNISYKVDVEVDRNVYLDAIRVANNNNKDGSSSSPTTSRDHDSANDMKYDDSDGKKRKNGRLIPHDAIKTGCLGMKKKPFKKRRSLNSITSPKNDRKPPPQPWAYHSPYASDKTYRPSGVELLWQPDTVTIYIYLVINSTNPLTLEAAAAALHNLCGCKWNWAAMLRIHARVERALPPLHDLLTVDQEYVVRSVAYALRNLAIDPTNKWSIGWFAPEGLIQVLPSVRSKETDIRPSEYTICAILSVLQAIVCKDVTNSKKVKDADSITKLVALTRETPDEVKEETSYRTYSNKVIVEANRVLLHMWEFKECREAIKKSMWSLQKAQDGERVFMQNTLKNASASSSSTKADTIADLDTVVSETVLGDQDTRRFVSFERKTTTAANGCDAYEMKNFGYQDVPSDEADESEALIRRSQKQKKNNKNTKIVRSNGSDGSLSSKSNRRSDNGDESSFLEHQSGTSSAV